MGYDSRVYIVQKSSNDNLYVKERYAQVIAMVEMGKFPALRNAFTRSADCYIFADDGNTMVLTDRYDEPLTEATLEEVMTVLEEAESIEHYRRATALLVLLRSFTSGDWNRLAVLHYGH